MSHHEHIVTEHATRAHLRQGCGCTPRGCFLILLLLYGLQCLIVAATLWHKYESRNVGSVQLTLYYPDSAKVSMFVPGVGVFPLLLHWVSWGHEQELIKAVDICLPDGRKHTLYREDFCNIDDLGIRETPSGIQLIDAQGRNWVDTPPIPYTEFHR